VEELIRRRPAAPNDTAVRSAQARLEQARAALAAAQASSAPDDWIYFGAGRGRAPRPEYEARLDSLDSEVKAAEQQLADEERKLRLGY
jgi:multidrug efflux pump subunit AcrA (membrane-fusion protein)